MAYNANTNERKHGSSGSIMLVLAKAIIDTGGVVYGAEFIDKLQLFHTRATDYDTVLRQSKSKYLQSNTSGIYESVRNDLLKGLNVLFVGTPCQTHALYNYLGNKNKERLLLVDFLCHGVPSQSLFDNAIHTYEKRKDCIVTDFSFREKTEKRLRCYKISYRKDGKDMVEMGKENDFPFYCGYLKYYPFRESCYECKFASEYRVSDITIGDMWGMEWTGELNDFQRGYSLVYTNNKKGYETIALIKEKLFLREFSLDDPRTENYTYKKHTQNTWEHKAFRLLYPFSSYRFIEQYFFSDESRRNLFQRAYFKGVKFCKLLLSKLSNIITRIKRKCHGV